MRKTRQLHLWIGMICSVFILIEAVTGLMMLEPWLIGEGGLPARGAFPAQLRQQMAADTTGTGAAGGTRAAGRANGAVDGGNAAGIDAGAVSPSDARRFPGGGDFGAARQGGAGVGVFVRNLHEGRIGGTDIRWVMDLAAIGMIALTVTGIVLSVKTLSARSARRKKWDAAKQQP